MSLAGLGYLAGGVSSGLDNGFQNQLKMLAAQAQRDSMSGRQDAGDALTQAFGGTPPPQQNNFLGGLGQSPVVQRLQGLLGGGQQPTQSAAPNALATRGGGGAAPMPQQAPQPQPQMPQAQPQGQPPQQQQAAQNIQRLDFPSITKILVARGLSGTKLMNALDALQPMMNAQAQVDYRNALMQVRQAEVPINQEKADASMLAAKTGAQVRPIQAGAEATRAQKYGENVDSEIKTRDVKAQIDQQKLGLAQQTQSRLMQSLEQRDVQGAQANLTRLLQQRTQALQAAAGDATDPTVTMIDSMIAEARQQVQALQGQPSQHPQGWDGKDQGRVEPEVAKPIGNSAKPADAAPPKGGMTDADKAQSLANAKQAIAKGWPRDVVIQKLKDAGIDPTGL